MIVLEGMMMAPPDRGTIIGRAVWKSRYVVLGTGSTLKTQNDIMSQTESRKKAIHATPSKPDSINVAQADSNGRELYISIYKAKGDWEFLAQHPISAFKSCEVKSVSHRKGSAPLPTLVFELRPDSISEKQRKRRSSRTGGLAKDVNPSIFLFRSIAQEKHNIYEWQATVQPLLNLEDLEDESLTSPTSPSFNFTNPFASRVAQGSANRSNQSQSPHPHAMSSRPSAMISPAPSLRSRRSDLSSQASSQHPPIGFASNAQPYSATVPTDLPSPASTSGYDNQFIEGWTSAQGRSSALSSHTRGSNSIASAIAPTIPNASTPPGPRETILDRAFQMRCIPGSEREREEEGGKMSSLARFEALMREHDARKVTQADRNRQDWDLEEESEESDAGEALGEDDDDDLEMSDDELEHDVVISQPAQRALDFISGKKNPIPSSSSSRPLSPPPRRPQISLFDSQSMSSFHTQSTGLRPRTGTTSSRTGGSRPASIALPSRSISTNAIPSLKEYGVRNESANLKTDITEKRRSSTSVKRLSFQEFTKRLSSTSSLLLVQTNVSSSSRRGSSETSGDVDDEKNNVVRRSGEHSQQDKRCGWRGSIGAFGVDGGFV